jgi:hypothetical protein
MTQHSRAHLLSIALLVVALPGLLTGLVCAEEKRNAFAPQGGSVGDLSVNVLYRSEVYPGELQHFRVLGLSKQLTYEVLISYPATVCILVCVYVLCMNVCVCVCVCSCVDVWCTCVCTQFCVHLCIGMNEVMRSSISLALLWTQFIPLLLMCFANMLLIRNRSHPSLKSHL